jgi:hypothetical protein
MCPVRSVTYVSGLDRVWLEARVGFEPTNGGFADLSWFSILLVRLAFTPAYLAGFGPDLGPIVPELFLIRGVTP